MLGLTDCLSKSDQTSLKARSTSNFTPASIGLLFSRLQGKKNDVFP